MCDNTSFMAFFSKTKAYVKIRIYNRQIVINDRKVFINNCSFNSFNKLFY